MYIHVDILTAIPAEVLAAIPPPSSTMTTRKATASMVTVIMTSTATIDLVTVLVGTIGWGPYWTAVALVDRHPYILH